MTHILLVEDEVLISREISKHLLEIDHVQVSVARSFEEAVLLLQKKDFALALLDVRLYGVKTGIDLAKHINQHYKTPFIYLTSHFDTPVLQAAKETNPSGYLTKPFQTESLRTTVEVALFNSTAHQEKPLVLFSDGKKEHPLLLSKLQYISADHVYTKLHSSDESLFVRGSITSILDQLPKENFIRVHRSFAVNTAHVKSSNAQFVHVADLKIPIGRSYRSEVVDILARLNQ